MSICVKASRHSIQVTSVWCSEESCILDWLNDDCQPDMEVQEDSDDGEVDQLTEGIYHSDTEEVEDNATVEDSETVTSDEERNVGGNKYFSGKTLLSGERICDHITFKLEHIISSCIYQDQREMLGMLNVNSSAWNSF
ncbi:hypothetical protein C0J52_15062 [Blattella germanica]|nr:hypothetical protein C0J52_15062 [Blattella germanica]